MTKHIPYGREIYVVDGTRTPFLKADPSSLFTASDLAVQAGRNLLMHYSKHNLKLDQVIIGCAMPSVNEANIARIIAKRLGLADTVPAYTVMRNCASGMQALDNACLEIGNGRAEIILAGGTEAMSHAPILYPQAMAIWLGLWSAAKTWQQKLAVLTKFHWRNLSPVIGLLRGLTDPLIGLSMGQTVEQLAVDWQITRKDMDQFAAASHNKLSHAYQQHLLTEITPIIDHNGTAYSVDNGLRADSTVEKLAKLKPYFDKKYGIVTAGNSSQITDGASLLLLASKDAVEKYNLPVLGQIIDCQWSALAPLYMGLGPVHASAQLLERHSITTGDIDYWEINEAFAGQVLACLAAWNSEHYLKSFGIGSSLGKLEAHKINQDGGAIAIGHPIGASGARIVLHALKRLELNKQKHAVATLCIGGGQGGAMYLKAGE